MRSIECPICGTRKAIGLPQDGIVEAISTEPIDKTAERGKTKTRKVRCPNEHLIYFTFSVNTATEERLGYLYVSRFERE